MKKKIPKFKNEDRERQFWRKHNSTNYIDWKKGKKIGRPITDEEFMKVAIEQAKAAAENGDVVIGGNNQGAWRNRLKYLIFKAPSG